MTPHPERLKMTIRKIIMHNGKFQVLYKVESKFLFWKKEEWFIDERVLSVNGYHQEYLRAEFDTKEECKEWIRDQEKYERENGTEVS